jgi:hypothetical protein
LLLLLLLLRGTVVSVVGVMLVCELSIRMWIDVAERWGPGCTVVPYIRPVRICISSSIKPPVTIVRTICDLAMGMARHATPCILITSSSFSRCPCLGAGPRPESPAIVLNLTP